MRELKAFIIAAILTVAAGAAAQTVPGDKSAEVDAKAVFQRECASCHGEGRLGGQGPALLPESLGRIGVATAAETIRNGRPATQMEGFGKKLSDAEIAALVKFVNTPLRPMPVWGMEEMLASREISVDPATLPEKPVFNADLLNLFVVVEAGDHHVTILNGDTFEPIHRFQSRFALHGGPKFTPDGRFVFFVSRDGWVTKFDIYINQVMAEIRAGINARNLALSDDGKVVAVANYLPNTLVLLDATDLKPLKIDTVMDEAAKTPSRVSAVYQAAPRNSFVAALKDVPEIWEVPTNGDSAIVDADKRFPVRRIKVGEPLDDFFFDPDYKFLIGSSRDGTRGIVVDLDKGETIASINLPGLPHLGSGIFWMYEGHPVMATPHLREPAVSVIDLKSWKTVKTIKTPGPGFFMRGHEKSPYAWTDVSLGPQKDTLVVIDTRSLEIVKTLTPEPGKTASHIEFTRDGRYVLASIWEMDGALVIYDAQTFKEIKRIPMVKPSGKYNVFNKITLSAGTSH